MPGLDDETRTRAPVAAAPSAMLIAPSSLSAWTKTRPELGHPPGHPLEQLGLGRDRVAEVGVAAGLDGGFGHRLVALHQDGRTRGRAVGPGVAAARRSRSRQAPFGRAKTVNTASGQIRAHSAQLVQAAASVSRTGW